jgi:hypothetical protein
MTAEGRILPSALAASEHQVGSSRERCRQQCAGRDGHQRKNQGVQNEKSAHGTARLMSARHDRTHCVPDPKVADARKRMAGIKRLRCQHLALLLRSDHMREV